MGIKATCCPDKTHYAKSKCKKCYYRDKYLNDPEWLEHQRATARLRNRHRAPRIVDYSQVKEKRDKIIYNLLPGERDKIRKYQFNRDPITGAPLSEHAHMDHDHRDGKLRGLLNPLTNKLLIDDEKKLAAMLDYIRHPPAPLALEETVYGVLGRARHKKKMRYGPDNTPEPHPRKNKEK